MISYLQLVNLIIKEQQSILGPIAIEQARQVSGLQVDDKGNSQIEGNEKKILSDLVVQYSNLFGSASIQVCKEAINPLLSNSERLPEIPDVLKD